MIRIIPEKSSEKKQDQGRVHFIYRGSFELFHILRVPENRQNLFFEMLISSKITG